jgi:hypothetical protein
VLLMAAMRLMAAMQAQPNWAPQLEGSSAIRMVQRWAMEMAQL